MQYKQLFLYLKRNFNQDIPLIEPDTNDFLIHNIDFVSENYNILPGEDHYEDMGIQFPKTPDYQNAISPEINEILNLADSKVYQNRFFKYSIFQPKSQGKSKGIILLFHGLNEKNWDKYLPWAKKLMDDTGKTIVLFPIAFHMNRAPKDWSDFRMMNDLKYVREGLFPAIVGSSFANVAMSTRLHILPQRFFWSGVQTFYDILQLIRQIRSNKHPLIEHDASVDFFAYSIGAFLTQILLMNNASGMFSDSRLFMFCGGAVFNRMTPVRKSILDSEANIALYSFFLEHFDNYLKTDERLAHYFSEKHSEGLVFKSMLDYNKMMAFREEKFTAMHKRLAAVTLRNDSVIPPYEVLNTLRGADREIPVDVKILSPSHNYSHDNPFPLKDKNQTEVNKSFNEIFDMASSFLA